MSLRKRPLLHGIPPETGGSAREEDSLAKRDRPFKGIPHEVQMTVQVRVSYVWPGEGQVESGGNGQRRLVHAADHDFEARRPRHGVDEQCLGDTAHLYLQGEARPDRREETHSGGTHGGRIRAWRRASLQSRNPTPGSGLRGHMPPG